MLTVLRGQLEVFEQAALRRFEEEMVVHGKRFSPCAAELLGDVQLRMVVQQAIARAGDHGFDYRGPIRMYLELMFLRGSDFDTDPQYAALGRALRGPGDQMARAQRLRELRGEYVERVTGPSSVNVHHALRRLSSLIRRSGEAPAGHFEYSTLHQMAEIFPQKVAYVGEGVMVELIRAGRTEARKHGMFTPQAERLVVMLMFVFGYGCTDDLLYPWISSTLRDSRIEDAGVRAMRLEKKTLIWVQHVLARHAVRAGA